MNDAPGLEACPFCGEELFVSKSGLAIHQGQSQSTCMIGSVGIPVDHRPSVDKWNTRIRPYADARAALEARSKRLSDRHARDKQIRNEALREAARFVEEWVEDAEGKMDSVNQKLLVSDILGLIDADDKGETDD